MGVGSVLASGRKQTGGGKLATLLLRALVPGSEWPVRGGRIDSNACARAANSLACSPLHRIERDPRSAQASLLTTANA